MMIKLTKEEIKVISKALHIERLRNDHINFNEDERTLLRILSSQFYDYTRM